MTPKVTTRSIPGIVTSKKGARAEVEQRARDLIRIAQAWTAVIALSVGVACGVGIFWSETELATDPLRPAITSILAAVLSAAVVSLAADVLLRDRFAHAFALLVRLRDDVRDAGLASIAMETEPDWGWVLSDADSLDVILIDPYPWLSRSWGKVATLAQSRGLELRILFVAAGSQACLDLETRVGRSLATSCLEAERLIKDEWEKQRRASELHANARVGLFKLVVPPAYDLVVARRNNRWIRSALIIGPSAQAMATAAPLVQTFEWTNGHGDDLATWAGKQMDGQALEKHRVWARDARSPDSAPAAAPAAASDPSVDPQIRDAEAGADSNQPDLSPEPKVSK